ncbi:Pyrroline-5-carboxylate reductase [hydrothermal vent metagenome]|uniref:Pyrroline-5-carboxylate reductase n=1 Tax=hydrothermal vent metagenome TaxID=652676 RepID=A0A3B1CDX8_9ZZZZ
MIGDRKIAFIGAGFMGKALIRGLVQSETVAPGAITAADSEEKALKEIGDELKIKTTSSNCDAAANADIVVMCVKPQVMENVMAGINQSLGGKTLVLSIAAGVTLSSLASWTPDGAKIVRAMPNLGAAVGASATALCAKETTGDNAMEMARELFNAVGKTVVVSEDMMDAVTGLSGSGPGFVFLFLEAMIDAGVRCGLPREAASTLATQTLYGSALLASVSGEHPAMLKNRVTSPGGTTIAGLSILENSMFRGSVINAIKEAAKRSKEMGDD